MHYFITSFFFKVYNKNSRVTIIVIKRTWFYNFQNNYYKTIFLANYTLMLILINNEFLFKLS